MKTRIYILYLVLSTFVLGLVSCEPRALTEDDVFVTNNNLESFYDELIQENINYATDEFPGFKIYELNEFLDAFMTEAGSYASDTTPYRERSYDATHDLYLYSVDTIPTDTFGIYIRGRISTDDYSGNFYKSMVIQRIVDGKQQNLRISVDLGSSGGMYQLGQEILIRCNGLAVGRYANQPQLCIPSYNNNIFAMNASQKVGWCPGRIQGSVFRKATRMIGTPDPSKLQYDEVTLEDIYKELGLDASKPVPTADAEGMDKVRKADGRLVIIHGVHFTGEFDNNGTLAICDTLHPDSSSNANVFAPTTNNIGYPQSRVIEGGSCKMMCSCSEYAKFAYFYIPGADRHGVSDCENWSGTVTGILGWYLDKASDMASNKLDGFEWSVTPRGIPGIGIPDIRMWKEVEPEVYEEWEPMEFNPNDYR